MPAPTTVIEPQACRFALGDVHFWAMVVDMGTSEASAGADVPGVIGPWPREGKHSSWNGDLSTTLREGPGLPGPQRDQGRGTGLPMFGCGSAALDQRARRWVTAETSSSTGRAPSTGRRSS